MLAKAIELAEAHGWFLCRQFENEANADAHSRTTAPEILDDFAERTARLLGHRLRHRWHAERRGARPEGETARKRRSSSANRTTRRSWAAAFRRTAHADGTPADSHPMFRPHLMQGWSPGFHSETDRRRCRCQADRRRSSRSTATTPCAMSRALAQKEGIFVGISGRRHARRRYSRLQSKPRPAQTSCACCRTPASDT